MYSTYHMCTICTFKSLMYTLFCFKLSSFFLSCQSLLGRSVHTLVQVYMQLCSMHLWKRHLQRNWPSLKKTSKKKNFNLLSVIIFSFSIQLLVSHPIFSFVSLNNEKSILSLRCTRLTISRNCSFQQQESMYLMLLLKVFERVLCTFV